VFEITMTYIDLMYEEVISASPTDYCHSVKRSPLIVALVACGRCRRPATLPEVMQ